MQPLAFELLFREIKIDKNIARTGKLSDREPTVACRRVVIPQMNNMVLKI